MKSASLDKVVPAKGTANVPVFLINFSDTTTKHSPGAFNTLLFGTGNYGMKDYFSEASYGAFTVSPGPAGIVGWYTASKGHDYYADMAEARLLGREAVRAADAAGFDFAPYDQNGDCYVDNLVVVHQGEGQEYSGDPTDIWSHSSTLTTFTTSNCAANPTEKVKVRDYTIQPELQGASITTVGVFCHEYGHALGLPDLYDTDYSSEGVGVWSLMASGSWASSGGTSGDRPSHLDAWSKWSVGWISPNDVTCRNDVSLPAVETSFSGFYRLLPGTATTGEYFLLENRQQTSFDAGLPGSGLLIWHVDTAKADNTEECWPNGPPPLPECSAAWHYKVALVQADNRWHLEMNWPPDNGDPYPPAVGWRNRTFYDSGNPNSGLYSGAQSGVAAFSISDSAATMTAELKGLPASRFLSVSRVGTGTVTSDRPGINCGADCTETYTCGWGVGLEAAPADGWAFAGWSGSCSGTGTCSLGGMNDYKTVVATFQPAGAIALGVSLAGAGAGTVTSSPRGIDCGNDCLEMYGGVTSLQLTAIADAESRFAGWSGGGCSGTETCTVTVASATTVTATFASLRGFSPLAPLCPVLDTRTSPNGPLAGPALTAGQTRAFDIDASPCGIPADAKAIAVNATVTGPTAQGYLTVFPGGESLPVASLVNFSPGQTRANNAVISLASTTGRPRYR